MCRHRPTRAVLVVLALVAAPSAPRAVDAPDWSARAREATAILSDYLRIDTTNPPGRELAAAQFLGSLLARDGIETRVIESAPGRGNVYARLRGDGTRKAVLLLNHLDVVPADARFWKVPPFGGEVKDGYVWGRGALDMKGAGVLQLMTMLVLKRHAVPLRADVIFLGTADEEAGGAMGAGFIVRQHWDLVKDAGVVLNEGGGIRMDGAGRLTFAVAVSEKTPLRVTLVVTGTPGHAAMPRPDSAVHRLVAALARVVAYQAPITVLPEVQTFYSELAERESAPWRDRYRDLAGVLKEPAVAAEFAVRDPAGNARVRNTIAVTVLEGSSKVNVIPSQASAQLDVRLLPGADPAAFLEELRRVVADDSIRFETKSPLLAGRSPDTHALFDVLRALAREQDPQTLLATPLLIAATDCRYFRPRGIPCYGFMPFRLSLGETAGIHGNNERVSVANLETGSRMLYEIVKRLAAD
jgi:acetylornithine deacetylase/succinyl-diaminopimelate desuccinylase-like protein